MLEMQIIGNLVRNPEQGQETAQGHTPTRFTVAVNHGREDVTFVDVTAWNQLGNNCYQYLAKGRKVYVAGQPSVRGWIGREGDARCALSLTARTVEFLSPKSAEAEQETAAEAPAEEEDGFVQVEDGSLPF